MRKILSLMLCIVLVMTLALTAFAEEADATVPQPASETDNTTSNSAPTTPATVTPEPTAPATTPTRLLLNRLFLQPRRAHLSLIPHLPNRRSAHTPGIQEQEQMQPAPNQEAKRSNVPFVVIRKRKTRLRQGINLAIGLLMPVNIPIPVRSAQLQSPIITFLQVVIPSVMYAVRPVR